MIDEKFADSVRRMFGAADEPVPTWMALTILVLMAVIAITVCIVIDRRDRSEEQEDEQEEADVPSPVAIRRQPAEVFETDCDLCGCGYRYTVDYVKDFTTICPHCGTKNPHGPADVDIISRTEVKEEAQTK